MRARRTTRTISASEIARNVKHFEMWSMLQGCEQVAFSDLPESFRPDVQAVFNVLGKLPFCLVDKKSKTSKRLKYISPPLWRFLRNAYDDAPGLFSSALPDKIPETLFAELSNVFAAWMELGRMRRAKDKWSESDYAAHVYNILRVIAIRDSACRTQCSIQLPLPLPHLVSSALPHPLPPSSQRVLHARTVIPDGAIFVRSGPITHLSIPKDSPYKRLKSHPSIRASCAYAFCFQATPCASLPGAGPAAGSGNRSGSGGLRLSEVGAACFGSAPGAGTGAGDDAEGFEFASAFWEDKKSTCSSGGGGGGGNGGLLAHAYRQNRMACAAALRHLHSLRVRAPVFGFVFADGRVRAHADWWQCEDKNGQGQVAIYSAPYPGPSTLALPVPSSSTTSTSERSRPLATVPAWQDTYVYTSPHEWSLDQPSSILSLFLTLRNLDQWTERTFVQRIEQGVRELVRDICGDDNATATATMTASDHGAAATATTASGKEYAPWRIGDIDDEDTAQRAASGRAENATGVDVTTTLTATVVAPISALSLDDTDANAEADADAADLVANDVTAPTPRPASGQIPTPAAPTRAKVMASVAVVNSPGTPSPKGRLRPRRNPVRTSSSCGVENAPATAAGGRPKRQIAAMTGAAADSQRAK